MNTEQKLILTSVDNSPWGEAVVDYAAWIANTVKAPLKFLHTVEHLSQQENLDLSGAIGLGARGDLLEELIELEQSRSRLLIKKGQFMLQAAKSKAKELKVNDIRSSQRHGDLTEALIELEDQIRVLVIGTRDKDGLNHSRTVSKIKTIVRALHKPILVVNGHFQKPQKIMLAYSNNAASQKALQMVSTSPLFVGMECHLVHVGESTSQMNTLMQAAVESLQNNNVTVSKVFLTGKIEEALINYRQQENLDLTVMGAFSHNKVHDFLLGSFTAKMLEKTRKPLLLLR
ncbi:MAG: universal stress protein [Gammaproteobacteria bacterium]|nr:universal stress protein [Gammaproteobacteria bacterium]NNC97392.1 universal stress protein [Gammaproteobacteria bacterium]NNM13572.1 universal stress protein [Gammaproteobacteria bacterium]